MKHKHIITATGERLYANDIAERLARLGHDAKLIQQTICDLFRRFTATTPTK